jgi:hypothetical protein
MPATCQQCGDHLPCLAERVTLGGECSHPSFDHAAMAHREATATQGLRRATFDPATYHATMAVYERLSEVAASLASLNTRLQTLEAAAAEVVHPDGLGGTDGYVRVQTP